MSKKTPKPTTRSYEAMPFLSEVYKRGEALPSTFEVMAAIIDWGINTGTIDITDYPLAIPPTSVLRQIIETDFVRTSGGTFKRQDDGSNTNLDLCISTIDGDTHQSGVLYYGPLFLDENIIENGLAFYHDQADFELKPRLQQTITIEPVATD